MTGTTRLRDIVTVATESVFYGTNSLAVRKIDRGNISTFTGAYQSVTVNGGKPYTLSASAKKTSGCSVNGAVLKLEALSGSTLVKTWPDGTRERDAFSLPMIYYGSGKNNDTLKFL